MVEIVLATTPTRSMPPDAPPCPSAESEEHAAARLATMAKPTTGASIRGCLLCSLPTIRLNILPPWEDAGAGAMGALAWNEIGRCPWGRAPQTCANSAQTEGHPVRPSLKVV